MAEKEKSLTDLTVSDPPHIKDDQSIRKIMWFVVLALMPSNIYAIFLLGNDALILLFASVVSAIAAEALYQILLKKPVSILDGSAAITGLLVAMNVPAGLPVWIAAAGSFFAIIVVKQLFGGLGFNIFNPALASIALLTAIWPHEMTTKIGNISHLIANQWLPYDIIFKSFVMKNSSGFIGEISILLLLAGAVFLFFKRIITWHIPAVFICTVITFMLLYYNITGSAYPVSFTILQVFSGGFLLCALFMATDMVTSPITGKGMIIFGIGCGILTSIIRLWADSGAICYAILIMNAAVPLIDKFTKPRVFGT